MSQFKSCAIGVLCGALALACFYVPVASLAHWLSTGELPTLAIKRNLFEWRWFESALRPSAAYFVSNLQGYLILSVLGSIFAAAAPAFLFRAQSGKISGFARAFCLAALALAGVCFLALCAGVCAVLIDELAFDGRLRW